MKAAAGNNRHQVVLKVGHAFGKKFKPWEAVKTANTIGKVAKVGGVAIAVGLEAYGVLADELAAVKAEQPEFERIDAMASEIHAARTTRSDLRDRLSSVQERAGSALSALASSAGGS